ARSFLAFTVFFTDPSSTAFYPLSLHDALPISDHEPDCLVQQRDVRTLGLGHDSPYYWFDQVKIPRQVWPLSDRDRILQVMGRCKLVPEWVKPSDRQVTDCYWLAYAGAAQNGPSSRSGDILRILEWVLFKRPDTQDR